MPKFVLLLESRKNSYSDVEKLVERDANKVTIETITNTIKNGRKLQKTVVDNFPDSIEQFLAFDDYEEPLNKLKKEIYTRPHQKLYGRNATR